MTQQKGHIDWYLLLAVAGLMLFSIAFVYSASASFADVKFGSSEKLFWNHGVRVFFGLVVVVVMAKIDYHYWQRHSTLLLTLAVLMLIFVLMSGARIKGATRWITFGFVNFQPSEFAKFALVLHISSLLAQKQEVIKQFGRGLLPLLLWTALVCFLIARQPNLSTASVIFLISMIIIFIGNANIVHLGGIALGGLGIAIVYGLSAEYRLKRLMAYFGSEGNSIADNVNYQLQQAILAFGSGRFLGVGPGLSRQRDWFLPESYGDFIYSIIGEEYGFAGTFGILILFSIIIWRGLLSARKATDDFGRFLATGITVTFGLYAFINAGVNCGLLPTTGLPMPFISYGGTSILFSAAALGMLLNISAQAGVYPRKIKVAPAPNPQPLSHEE